MMSDEARSADAVVGMETWALTLTEFLLARIAEDEAMARNAIDDDTHWLHLGGGQIVQGDAGMTVSSGWIHLPHRYEAADHIARHDPARALAEVRAKRRIVEEYVARDVDVDLMLGSNSMRQREWSGLRLALYHLATIYAAHPDYDEVWRP